MTKLTELKNPPLKITSDEELDAWKSTWDGVSNPPKEVYEYMTNVVFPREQEFSDRLMKQWMSYK